MDGLFAYPYGLTMLIYEKEIDLNGKKDDDGNDYSMSLRSICLVAVSYTHLWISAAILCGLRRVLSR